MALIIRNISLSIALLMLLGGSIAQARIFTPVGATNGLEAWVVPSVILDSK